MAQQSKALALLPEYQHPLGGSQLSIIPVPGLCSPLRAWHTQHIFRHTHTRYTHTNKSECKKKEHEPK